MSILKSRVLKIIEGTLSACLRIIKAPNTKYDINLNSAEITEMTPHHRATLMKLSQAPLACRLDKKPAKDITEDLKPDTYRWFKHVYTNTDKTDLTRDEKIALIMTSMILLNIHLITWRRDKLYDITPEKKQELSLFVGNKISETTSAELLRILIYISRMMPSDIYLDDEMIKSIPELLSFAK